MNNNHNQSHELPNIGLSNQQLLSSLNASSAAGAGNATSTINNMSSANTNNLSNTTNALPTNLPSTSRNTTNNPQGILNIPLSQLPSPTLCASCDKCRQRKTKCDGNRPCLNCITRYRKMKKLDARYVFILFSFVFGWRVWDEDLLCCFGGVYIKAARCYMRICVRVFFLCT